ncbi:MULTISPECIES: DUF4307 domain-containing protein [unclassified Plantactinospora]|uniref:DUF4307 domain-containing protein n=1 Tax=unclassified Plantactinospora TaxID=2631981 RepID=UPI000D16FAE6|nr:MULTISPECIES: DUF4307 domain-containing protein [unclassified Plantactinospora]AVT31425.1 DUF4307 domain-containing protein [Plantactinospora sp. BC1]AVT38907.1 DUF4307 domain-containing protein [Plantactinospora sp. BB1]
MSETPATPVPTAPVFPPGRYGHRRAQRRRRPWVAALLAVALLVVMSAVSYRLYRQYGDPNYDAQVITYTEITDSQLVLDFRVTVPAGGSAICVLRARSKDGAEVAREEVRVDAEPGQRHLTARHRLVTTARPILGEVLRCRPTG